MSLSHEEEREKEREREREIEREKKGLVEWTTWGARIAQVSLHRERGRVIVVFQLSLNWWPKRASRGNLTLCERFCTDQSAHLVML